MCGIAGLALSRESRRTLDRRTLVRMRDVMEHRGPDDCGLFLDGRTGLAHRRLSVIDVAGGHQPMGSDDGSLHIVYNGEVYNHRELRTGLEARGHHFRTHCDTETVLRLHQEMGPGALDHLRGMFAFAIWDSRTGELFLARDRFGVKPLYYVHTEDGSLYFASEVKALLAGGAVRPALNRQALPDYLANHAPSGEETLFAGVRRLPPGHYLIWKNGEVRLHRYWKLSFVGSDHSSRSESDLVADFEERFREAVRLRLMADVPLGMFLSGGIDSAAITAAMSQLVDDRIRTFSVAFAEREANELYYARVVARCFRTEHHEVVVSPAEFFAVLPQLVWHEDEPIAHPSSVALFFLSRLAARHVKVVLTGEGSDETLAGYNRYRATVYQMAAGRQYQRLAPDALRRRLRDVVVGLPPGRLRQRLGRTILARAVDLDALYFDNFAVFSRAEQPSLMTAELRDELSHLDPYEDFHSALAGSDAPTLLGRLLFADTQVYLPELLMKQDQMSMAASIESRVPFLDHPLVEFVARLPDRMKLRGLTTKYILRQAMRHQLPTEILSRRKMGFPVPVGAWLRGAWRPLLDDLVLGERALGRGLFDPDALHTLVRLHQSGENHAERLWALLNLELWHRVFIDGDSEPAADLPEALAATA